MAGEIAKTFDVLGVAEEEVEVVVDSGPFVLAAVVGAVLPPDNGIQDVFERVGLQRLLDALPAFGVELGSGLAGRLTPSVEDLLVDRGVRSTSTSTSTSCARARGFNFA